MQSPGPIPAASTLKALGETPPAESTERAALDAAELQDLERLTYYGGTPAVSKPIPAPRRGLLDRWLRRRSPSK